MVQSLRGRRFPAVRGAGVKPLLHVDDAVTATVAALDHAPAGAAYNIADDEPASLSDLARTLAATIGAPRPLTVPPWLLAPLPYARAIMLGDLRVSTAKARDELGWTPRWPTYRDGVATFVAHDDRSAR